MAILCSTKAADGSCSSHLLQACLRGVQAGFLLPRRIAGPDFPQTAKPAF